ncbi:MAG: IS3 family transposase [Gammaproteobacteria bacterium]
MGKRRTYSTEFKLEAIAMAKQPGVTKTQIAKELGLNSNMIGRWEKELTESGSKAFPGQGHSRDEEVTALKRELARVKQERDFLPRSGSVLRERPEVKYQMIERCREAYPVQMMCRRLGVSTSGFYAWRSRPLSARTKDNLRLVERMQAMYDQSDGVLGSPRMWEDLRYEGETCSKNRVARLMCVNGLKGVPVKRRSPKKKSGTRPDGVRNHLARDFKAEEPNVKWVTDIDITGIRVGQKWLYLCAVMDLFSGMIVGWSMNSNQNKHLVLQAVLMALWQRDDRSAVILHSDRGCQFTSHEYQHFLADHNLTCSMSAVGSCADNAAMEGFFGMMKRERTNRKRYTLIADLRADIFDYIERFHNPRRRRRLEMLDQKEISLTKPSAVSG